MIQSLFSLDANILLAIQDHLRTPVLSYILIYITHLGDHGMIWILLTLALLIPKKTRKIGLMSACALTLSLLINNGILKNVMHRIRPYEIIPELKLLIEKQWDYSFPSGHTASSFASSFVLLQRAQKKYAIPAVIFAFIMAFSRLYVGVHFPSDVLFGMLSGIVCSILGVMIVEKVYQRFSK